jgi:RES domain-containing protein
VRAEGEGQPAPRRLPLLTWDTPLYCHVPVERDFEPSALTDGADGSDRWSRPGQPTAYLASDAGVAMAEMARHHPPSGARVERRVMRLDVRPRAVHGLVDLRDPAVLRSLHAPVEAAAFLDPDTARVVADRVREDPLHRGLIVPSMAFLDHPERPNIVLFGERLGAGGVGEMLAGWREVARVAVGGP